MPDTTITSANSILILTVPGLYGSGVKIQGFSSDKAFATEAVDMAEIQMGVDGRMTAGYVPNPVKQTVTLQADSPSKDIFSTVIEAQKTTKEIYWLAGVLTLPSTGETFALIRGVLSSAKQIPDAEKVLSPQDYVITWERVQRSIL